MKTLVISMLLLFSLAGWWQWQQASREKLKCTWRDARFLNPEVTSEIIEQRLNIRTQRPPDFIADIKQAAQAEYYLWEAQFEKGAKDRQQRLLCQQQSEMSIKAGIKEHLLDEAWLEQQLQKTAPPVSDADARAWFTQHAESLRIPALHHVSHLFLTRHDPKKPDRSTEIRALHQRLMRGENWAELTSQHSEDERNRHRAGDLGWLSRERMPADFMTAVEAQKLGSFSQPIQTRLGWHILRITERKASRLPRFEEVRSEIKAWINQAKREAALKAMTSVETP
jgi:parvulin-like peptidyl-prolyl isomerase